MITNNYTLTSYSNFLHQLAASFHTTVQNNRLDIPPAYGSGYLQVIKLDNALEAVLYNLTLNDTLVLKREGHDSEHYLLIFDDIEREKGFRVTIDSDM
ncbi:MAG TPA: hypothetical protein VM187_04285, partial [Niastella sp.]|nr:hypothetical protein [Niastella sp.]